MARPQRILLLGMQFPPARGSGVYRIRSWANHFARRGHEVTVLAANRDYWVQRSDTIDDGLLDTVDPQVRVVPVRLPIEHLKSDIRTMSWAHANFPRLWITSHERARNLIFPEVYASVTGPFMARAVALHARRRFDLVFASGNPYTQYGVANRLGRTLRRPYVVDYHDPWTLNPLTEADAFAADHPAFAWERRIVDHAALTVTVNEPLAQWYRDRYPSVADRVRVVENGLETQVLNNVTFAPRPASEPLRFGFVGTVRSDLPLEEFLEGWRRARKEPELAGSTMDFYGYLGFFPGAVAATQARLHEGADGITYRGPVSQTELSSVYSQLDALAMLLPSSKYMTSGKAYDYMASGRPVVGVHEQRNHTTAVFADYPMFFPAGTVDADHIAQALVAAARAARQQTAAQFQSARAEGMRHTWDAAMQPVAEEIEGWRQ